MSEHPDRPQSDLIHFARACLALGHLDAAIYHYRCIKGEDLLLPDTHALSLEIDKARAARRAEMTRGHKGST